MKVIPMNKSTKEKQTIPAIEPEKNIKMWWYLSGLVVLCVIFYYRIIFGVGNFWEDLIYLEFPHRVFARDALLSFQFPHWNPYTFSGMPFFASLNTGVLYPFNLLISLFPVSNATYWYLLQNMIVAHFLFAGISMFFYMRHRKCSGNASFFAALGFMFCGFFVTHVVHSMMLNILVWLPLVILFLEKGIKEHALHHLLISGLILGVSTLAGHPQITFYEFLFLGCYGLYLWWSKEEKSISGILFLVIPFVIAVGIAMITLLPAMELNANCSRVSWTFEQASEGSIKFIHLLTLFIPKAFGAWTGPDSDAPRFWLDGPNYGYYTFWDTCIYAGIAIFILALVQFKYTKKSSFVLFSLIWLITTFAIALGNHFFIYKLLFNFAPGFSRFRTPTRITFTWCFLLPTLAATTFDQLRNREFIKSIQKPLFIILGVSAALALITALGMLKGLFPIQMEDEKNMHHASKQGLILLFNVLALGVPLLLLSREKLSASATQYIIIGALFIDLLIFGSTIHITKNESAARHFNQAKEITEALQKESKKETFRVNARQFTPSPDEMIFRQSGLMMLKRNQGMIDKIQITEGFNPLNLFRRLPPLKGDKLDALLDLENIKYYVNPHYSKASPNLILLNKDRLPRAKMFYKARVLESDSLVKKYMLENTFDYREELLLSKKPSNPLPDDPNLVDNRVTIKKYSPNKIILSVTTEKNGLLWLSEIWYPAWKAYINGKKREILVADYSFRAIEVPEGTHTVEFVYRSSKFTLGMIMTLVTLLIACGYLGYVRFKTVSNKKQ